MTGSSIQECFKGSLCEQPILFGDRKGVLDSERSDAEGTPCLQARHKHMYKESKFGETPAKVYFLWAYAMMIDTRNGTMQAQSEDISSA